MLITQTPAFATNCQFIIFFTLESLKIFFNQIGQKKKAKNKIADVNPIGPVSGDLKVEC